MIYTIKQAPDKKFTDKMDLTRFIKANKEDIAGIKNQEYKTFSKASINPDNFATSFVPAIEDITSDFIEVKAIINTTNVIDSHHDLHLPGIWTKTVKENPTTYQLKLHEKTFESVLSSKAKQYNEAMNFLDLGLKIDMAMEANVNQFILSKSMHPYMFAQYATGEVKQHSVGMMYVNVDVAYYDEESEKEMDFFNWAKSQAINPEVADEYGYIWVVREAKKREGSAVVFGSNSITPTVYVKNYEPQKSTQKTEPVLTTQKEQQKTFIDLNHF